MHFEGDFQVRSKPDHVYSVLVEPERIVKFLPDVEVLELRTVDADTVVGKVKTGVSFLKGTFTVDARIIERDPPKHAKLKVRSQGMGSSFDIETTADLAPAGEATHVNWKADVAVRGTIASIGARLLPGLVQNKTMDFIVALRKEIEG